MLEAKKTKLKIGVLMGGISVEREVSFNSGRTICDHVDEELYEVIPIFQTQNRDIYILPWRFLHRGKISDFEHRLPQEAEKVCWDDLKHLVDFVFISVHGQYAEDGKLQGMLEVLDIPYLGSKVFASALGINKIAQKDFLQFNGVCVPRGIVLTVSQIKTYCLEDILQILQNQNLQFPLVIKPAFEGSSVGISVVFKEEELFSALNKASFEEVLKPQDVVIEEKITGLEFSCISLQKKSRDIDESGEKWTTLSVTEVILEKDSHFFDYEQKYMPGRAIKITPARCSKDEFKKIEEACIKTSKVLGSETISRIDGFLTAGGEVVIIDPNTLSGMGPASFIFNQAAEKNMNHSQLINYLIDLELEQYGIKKC